MLDLYALEHARALAAEHGHGLHQAQPVAGRRHVRRAVAALLRRLANRLDQHRGVSIDHPVRVMRLPTCELGDAHFVDVVIS